MNKQKLQKLISRFDGFEEKTSNSVHVFEQELSQMVQKMKSEVTMKTLDSVNQELTRIKRLLDFSPIASKVQSLKEEIASGFNSVRSDSDEMKSDYIHILKKFEESISKYDDFNKKIGSLSKDLQSYLKAQLDSRDLNLINSVKETKDSISINKINTEQSFREVSAEIKSFKADVKNLVEKNKKELDELRTLINSAKLEFMTRANGSHGGGSMNRKISTNGTVISTRYTDINFKGSGISYSAVNNDTTRQVDLTLSSASGGGYQQPTGTVDGTNATFVFVTAPNVIVVDNGRSIQKTSSDGTVNWTGTTTVVLTVAPNFDIFSTS